MPVPRVLGCGDGRLHTKTLPGRPAVDPRWVSAPRAGARAIGAGLGVWHDSLPVAECPFDWSVAARLAELAASARVGLQYSPPIDRLVVCHGDACAPNTMIGDDGRCSGHVDVGDLGVADRWAGTLSLGWNYPGGPWDSELLDAYGMAPDPARTDYYRRLWQASDITSR